MSKLRIRINNKDILKHYRMVSVQESLIDVCGSESQMTWNSWNCTQMGLQMSLSDLWIH